MASLFKTPEGAPDPLSLAVRFCTAPAEAMRLLLDYNPGYFHWPLIGIMTVVGALAGLHAGLDMLIGGVILSGISTLVSVYGLALLFWLTGKPLKGQASFKEMTAAILWSMVPLIPVSLLGFFFGMMGEFFMSLDFALTIMALMWTVVLLFYTVAEAQRFSLWASFWNQTFALGIVSLLVLVVLLPALVRLLQYYSELNSLL